MALFEAVANVVTRYKADVTDNIKGLQKLKGEERARAEALLEQHKKTNDALESQIRGYQKIASGVVLLAAGFAAATKGLDAYAKTSDEAKAKVEKLKETSSQAFDALYAGIGETVVALSPLIEGVSSLIMFMNDLGIAGPAAVAAIGLAITRNPQVAGLLAAVTAGATAARYLAEDGSTDAVIDVARAELVRRNKARNEPNMLLSGDDETSMLVRIDNAIGRTIAKALDKGKAKGGKPGPAAPTNFTDNAVIGGTDYGVPLGAVDTRLGAAADSVPRDMFGREVQLDVMAPYQKLVDAEKSRQSTVLERMFGPLEEFDAYAESFGMLTGAATAAYDALVEGNMSAGDAMKAFLKDAIKGLGSRMLIRSLEETAEGVAALSNPLTAAAAPAHFQAAGLFAAGAVTAGLVASRMGGGGGGGGGGGSASLPRDMGTGRDQYEGGRSKVIIIGDPMSDDSPRYQARNIAKQLTRAERTSAGRFS
jgi:hypothetical protein